MTLWDQSARALLDATASDAPTPGGGSIACVAGALGVGLVAMAVAVTKKSATTPELEALAVELAAHRAALETAADDDVAAFDGYMAALALPRTTDEEKSARKASLAAAAERAARPPARAAERLLAALGAAERAATLSKRSVVSDVFCGADLARGAALAALRNVDINLPQVAEPVRSELATSRAMLEREVEAAYARVLALR
jgi:formiminotetrahydrofolate cyclodeaminase